MLLFRHQNPWSSPAHGLVRLGPSFALADCCKLCLVGCAGGLCIVCPPITPLGVLKTSPRQKMTALPCPAGGGVSGECQAVALTLWVQPLGGLEPGPFYNLPTISVEISHAGTGNGGPLPGKSVGGVQPCPPVLSSTSLWLRFSHHS